MSKTNNLVTVTKAVVGLGRIAFYGVVVFKPLWKTIEHGIKKHKNKTVYYDDAVKAIMESNMLDSNKLKAVKALPRHETTVFYEAIISIIDSDMIGSNKAELIETLCQEDEEESE